MTNRTLIAGLLMVSLGAVLGCRSEQARGERSAAEPERAALTRTSSAAASARAKSVVAAANPVAMGPLTRINDPSQVCMVNNQFMGRAQIPVEVEGRTYFGCCEMCKGRLSKDAAARTAVDPISRRTVDKASAVLARAENGSVLYFEDERTLAQYAAAAKPPAM